MSEIDPHKETLILSNDKLFGPTLEGEGEYMGHPSIFMRMAMCNLSCAAFQSADSPHGCDSFISWSVKNKYTFWEIYEQFFIKEGYRDYLRQCYDGNNNHRRYILKLTGGEPTIQSKQLLKFLTWYEYQEKYIPRIDIETNATILPDNQWVEKFKATFTTSPKLSTNGDPENKTFKPEVLRWHVKHNSGFKFVINSESDIEEVFTKYIHNSEVGLPLHRIWFMPCCGSRKEHIEKGEWLANRCKEIGIKFSPRLQLILWDKALLV